MPTLPNTTRGRRVLIGAAFLSLFAVTFLLVKDKDQKESQPEVKLRRFGLAKVLLPLHPAILRPLTQ